MRSEDWNLLTASTVSVAVIFILLFLFQMQVFYAFATKFLAVDLGLYLGISIDRKREAQERAE